jgi:hypothetical protein
MKQSFDPDAKEPTLPKIPMTDAQVLQFPKDKDTYILAQQGDFIALNREDALKTFKGLAEFLGIKVKV